MIFFRRLSYLFALFTLLWGCSKTPYLPYHSTAGIPHDSRLVETQMRMITLEASSEEENPVVRGRSYAVISALDNSQRPYILIAPAKKTEHVGERQFWDFDISYSTSISPAKTKELVNSLKTVLQQWDFAGTENDGFFYEFTNTPEHKIFQQTENVVVKNPSLKVNFNITEEGSVGALIIGEGDLKYQFMFEEKQKVQTFHDLLVNGLSELKDMS